MTRTINLAAMTTKTIMQTSTVSEKFDREKYDQGTHEIEDQTNQEMRNMKNEKIPLTVANTIFQTNKQSIEADPNQTLQGRPSRNKILPRLDHLISTTSLGKSFQMMLQQTIAMPRFISV